MATKDQDLHNLFTPDPTSKKNLEKCSLKDATTVTVNGKKFTLGQTFEKFNAFAPSQSGITLRLEFDRYTDLILEKDFDLFGIECYKLKEHKPITFTTKVVEHSNREVDNHGMTYDVVDSVCVILPDQFVEFLNHEVEIIVKVK